MWHQIQTTARSWGRRRLSTCVGKTRCIEARWEPNMVWGGGHVVCLCLFKIKLCWINTHTHCWVLMEIIIPIFAGTVVSLSSQSETNRHPLTGIFFFTDSDLITQSWDLTHKFSQDWWYTHPRCTQQTPFEAKMYWFSLCKWNKTYQPRTVSTSALWPWMWNIPHLPPTKLGFVCERSPHSDIQSRAKFNNNRVPSWKSKPMRQPN